MANKNPSENIRREFDTNTRLSIVPGKSLHKLSIGRIY